MGLFDRLKRVINNIAGEKISFGKPKSTFSFPDISGPKPASENSPRDEKKKEVLAHSGKTDRHISSGVGKAVSDPAINHEDPPPPYSSLDRPEHHAEPLVISRQFMPFSSSMSYEEADRHEALEAKHAEAANYKAPPSPRSMDKRGRDAR